MIIIKEENDNKNNFFERMTSTQNNLFLCSSVTKELNESENNIIEYKINDNIIVNKIEKINNINNI